MGCGKDPIIHTKMPRPYDRGGVGDYSSPVASSASALAAALASRSAR